jgi:small-conductance mechanosensitive channel
VEAPIDIPAFEVPRRADEASTRLRAIRARIVDRDETRPIEEALPDVASSVSRLEEDPHLVNEGTPSPRVLDDLRQNALSRKVKLEGWNRVLEGRAEDLLRLQAEIRTMQELWERTREDLLAEDAVAALAQDPDSVLARAGRVESLLNDRLARVQILQGDISRQLDRIQGILDRIEAVSKPSNFTTPERTPLWEWTGTGSDSSRGLAGMKEGWRNFSEPFPDFLRRNRGHLLFQLSCFLIVAGLIFASARRARRAEGEPLPDEARIILERPITSALLATLLLTRFLYPYAPSGVFAINSVLAIPPLLRILPRMVPPPLKTSIWGLAGLFFLDVLSVFLLNNPFLSRIHLLLLTLLALAGGLFLLRSGRLTDALQGRSTGVVLALVRLGVLILGIAVVANLIGAVALATVLFESVLPSTYLCAIGIVLIRVLGGMVHVMLRSRPLNLARSVRENTPLLERRARSIVKFGIIILLVAAALRFLRVLDAFWSGLVDFLGTGVTLGAVRIDFGTVLLFLAVLWISTLLSRFVRFILGEDVLPRLHLSPGIPQTITQLVHYAVITIGFLLAVASTGFDLTRLTILAGALGVGIGFGLQTIVNNFVSGLVLMVERPVRIGDTIEVGTLLGRVKRIGMRASVVRTFSGADVVVPNGDLLAGNLVNWTLSDPHRRVEVPVGVAYGTDVERMRELLLEVAKSHPDCLKWPEPAAFFLGFGDSSLDFELRFWTGEDFVRVRSEIAVHLSKALAEAGIEIPFPQRDVHLKTAAPAVDAQSAKT